MNIDNFVRLKDIFRLNIHQKTQKKALKAIVSNLWNEKEKCGFYQMKPISNVGVRHSLRG